MAGFILFLAAFFALLTVIAMCKILAKADIPWGFLFIPVYGVYCTYKVADCTGIFWANLIFAVANAVIPVTAVRVIISIILIIMNFVYCKCMAEAFGKGAGFALGLFFLSPIFILILGFGDAEHEATAAATSTYTAAYPSSAKDWRCPKCNVPNAVYRSTCKGCGYVKPVLYASAALSNTSSEPEWKCPTCSTSNSGSRSTCENCGYKKYVKGNPVKDTWKCPDCDTRNPNTTRNCKGCGRLK